MATRRKKTAPVAIVKKPGDDPVRGLDTEFVKAFDEPPPAKIDILTGEVLSKDEAALKREEEEQNVLNFRLTKEMVLEQLELSKELSRPSIEMTEDDSSRSRSNSYMDEMESLDETEETTESEYDLKVAAAEAAHDAAHHHASEAIERILKLNIGSSKDRMRVNFDKCITTFGRHNTDHQLPSRQGDAQKVKDRAGPDVGSSEVQIAIATVKIRNLANFIKQRGKKDHHNKRNLRLLVHKRQKMLKYLRRKERGGPRWQHVINTLGLTEATWKGEIVV